MDWEGRRERRVVCKVFQSVYDRMELTMKSTEIMAFLDHIILQFFLLRKDNRSQAVEL